MIKWLRERFSKKPEPVGDGKKVNEAAFMLLPLGARFRIVGVDGVYKLDDFRRWDTTGYGDMATAVTAIHEKTRAFTSMTVARKQPSGINPRSFVPIRDIRVISE